MVSLFLKGIPLSVQSFCVRELRKPGSFTKDDLGKLPNAENGDKRQTVYGIIAEGVLKVSHTFSAEGYGGSTDVFHKRMTQHLSCVRRIAEGRASDSDQRSMLYQQLARDGATATLKRYASFKKPIARAFVFILESIFMILLGTYYKSRNFARFNTKASQTMAKDIRASLGLAPAPWKGLHYAFPLLQGCPNKNSHKIMPCANCGTETYPRRPDENGKMPPGRCFLHSDDPVGSPFVCKSCHYFKYSHQRYPDAKEVERLKLQAEKNARNRRDYSVTPRGTAICGSCGERKKDGLSRKTALGIGPCGRIVMLTGSQGNFSVQRVVNWSKPLA